MPEARRRRCKHHPRRFAEHRCVRCEAVLCVECARAREFTGVCVRFCPCSGECLPLADDARLLERPTFEHSLYAAVVWPVQDRISVLALFLGALFFAVFFDLIGCASVIWVRPIGYLFTALFTGYVCAFAFDVIAATATGRDGLPDWPDALDLYDDMFKPLMAACLLALVAFGPCGIAVFAGGPWWTIAPLALIGVLVFSLACAGLSQGGGTWSAALDGVLRLAVGVPGPVLGASLAIALLTAATLAVREILVRVPIAGGIAAWFAVLWTVVACARILGLLWREHAARRLVPIGR